MAFTGVSSALARLASGEAANALKDTGLEISAATLERMIDWNTEEAWGAGLDNGQLIKALGQEGARAMLLC